MGRSVSTPSNAQVVTYKSIDFEDGDDFEFLVDDFRDHLRYLFPSVVSADSWIGREDHVVAENGLAQFGISEYCGLVAYWIVPKEDPYDGRLDGIAKRWIDSIEPKFTRAFGEYRKTGSMSNGEGVYQRI
jgi:hypothetical protein